MRTAHAAIGSAAFFAVAPVVVTGLVPWLITDWRMSDPPPWLALRIVGAVLIVAGGAAVVHAFVKFVVDGLGTPAPIAPPTRLVVRGPYRFVRNPMYVAVLAAIIGQASLLGSPALLVYAVIVLVPVVAFVRVYEEPTLRRTFGEEYERYRRAVPGWWPRLRPWTDRD
ncbi:methyltransferase family protein [Herbihabitans rhizosphaerae]|nr:isoprenylcysteine carboxylmethyltransferase family protein [Herbihabitans rhizosphaerae]